MSQENEQLEQQVEETPEQKQGKEAKKVEKRYSESINKLTSLLKGDTTVFKKPRIANSDLDGVLEELLKERREEATKKFKVDALAFFDKKVAFDKLVAEKEKAFQAEITKAKKEFADEADKLFNQIEDINQMVRDYRSSLNPSGDAGPATQS